MSYIEINRQSNSRSMSYTNGNETQHLVRYEHYNEPFENCEFFKSIKQKNQCNKYKEKINQIGEKYNNDFRNQIKNRTLPKFKRDFKRNLGLAVWFFEEIAPSIYPWLINENII